jgi:hypothetical protein
MSLQPVTAIAGGGRLALTALLAVLVMACAGPVPTGTPPTSAGPGASATSGPGPSGAPAAQTDTEWGRIWDAVPAGFPRYPGATTADAATREAVSDASVVAGVDPAEVGAWFQGALESATFSTESMSPLEDGSVVIDSVGDGDCRIQTRVAPLGEMVLITVLYGADCPV